MSHNPDTYYSRSEVSNSDLTELKNILHPRMQFGDKEAAFRFGSLVDAIITEPARVDYYRLTVDDEQYTEDEFRHAQEMQKALRMEARRDEFLFKVLGYAETQRFMVNTQQQFTYCGFPFLLIHDVSGIGGSVFSAVILKPHLPQHNNSLKKQLTSLIGTGVVLGIWTLQVPTVISFMQSAKKNCKVFKKFINRDDKVYSHGREKYEELAFQYWCLTPQDN